MPHTLRRSLLVLGMLILACAPLPTSAAIPCHAPPSLIDLPSPDVDATPPTAIDFETMLAGDHTERLRPTSDEAGTGESQSSDTESIVRCAGYGDFTATMSHLTPEYAANRLAGGELALPDNVATLQYLGTWDLPNGDQGVTVELLIDDTRLLVVDLVWTEVDGYNYLVDSAVVSSTNIASAERLELRCKKVAPDALNVSQDEAVLVWIEVGCEQEWEWTLTNDQANEIAEGRLMGEGMTGGPDDSVLVLHDLEPGDYELKLIPLGDDGFQYGQAQVVTITVEP